MAFQAWVCMVNDGGVRRLEKSCSVMFLRVDE